jgi:1-phosphofructokinase
MIYIVAASPSLDYYMPLERLNKGEVNRSQNAYFTVGGKGINVAKTLLLLGVCDVRCFGFIAGFTGDEIKRRCSEEKLSTEFIKLNSGNSRVNVKIGESGSNATEINAAAPENTEGDAQKLLQKLREIKSGDYLVLTGSTPNIDIYEKAADICKENGGWLIVDCDGEALHKMLSSNPFLIKPNHYEFCKLCGIPQTDDREILTKELERGHINAENVLLSLGSKGAILASKGERTLFFPAPEGIAKNTVGAGDTMLAAFLKELITSNADREKALEFAVLTASKYVFGI